jgi:hypothetical protein
LRRRLGIAEGHPDIGQHPRPPRRRQSPQLAVSLARLGQALARHENDIRRCRYEVPSVAIGRIVQDQQRVALRWPRNVERAAHGEKLTGKFNRMHALGINKRPARLVERQGGVFPAVPQLLDDFDKLSGTLAILRDTGCLRRSADTRSQRLGPEHVGDPGGAAVRKMVERGENPRDMKRLGVVDRPRGRDADLSCDPNQRAKQRQRVDQQGIDFIRASRGVDWQTQQHSVEFAAFGGARHLLDCHRIRSRR